MIKRLSVVFAGVTMMGATIMSASAASLDLAKYPDMFVKDGKFDGYFVVGEKSNAVDNLATIDISNSMTYLKASDTTTTTVEGDAWKVGTSAKYLEIANNNATSASSQTGEQIRGINTFIGADELEALADGKWVTNAQEYPFQQFLFFDDAGEQSEIVKYAESDDDVTADFFYIKSGNQIARYKMEFGSTAQSDVTDSAGTASSTGLYLDDFEDTTLNLMGTSYSVVQARRTSATTTGGKNAKLTLMAGATKDTLLEGESKTYKVGDKEYDVTLTYVDSTYAKFTVNGEATNKLQNGETYILSDKSEVGVSEVLYQSYAGGIHSATFYVGASKIELKDDDITSNGGTTAYTMKVGSEDTDGTLVDITGTNNNVTAAISTIEINMTAEDDYFVPADGKLSDVIAAVGEDSLVLINKGYDFEYKGLSDEVTHDLKLGTSSSRKYQLTLYDGDNNQVDIPVAYGEGYTGSISNLSMGANSRSTAATSNDNKALVITENEQIRKDDYFILTAGTASAGSAKSYLMQYKGADATSKTSPKIKFKNQGSGETLEYAASSSNATATIKIGGYSFAVYHAATTTSDDFPILIDQDGSGALATGVVTFVDSYGSQWAITNTSGVNGVNGTTLGTVGEIITLTQTTPNADDYDNQLPSTVQINITVGTSDPEVRAALSASGGAGAASGLTLLTPEGTTEVSYGYTSMGTFVTFNEPASDPDEAIFSYPEHQRLAEVYLTSGATVSSSAGGTSTRVEVVDASKLDSEISDVKAQNLIVVGGPCVNSVAAELLGNPADCAEGFTAGKAMVKLFDNGGKVAMLVAGYTGDDTRLAGKVLANTKKVQQAGGTEVEIEGTTSSDAVVGAPTVVVAEEAAPVVETPVTE